METGTEAEAREECCLRGLLSLLSYRIQNHLPNVSTAPGGLGPPTLIINQKVPQTSFKPISCRYFLN